ncbi:MAG: hypothetical protein WA102_05615 [Candidatus Methanoperedens sp.]
MLKTEFRATATFVMAAWLWGTLKVIENYDIDEITDAAASANESNNPMVLEAGKWASSKIQTEPEKFTKIVFDYGYENKKMSWKYVSTPWMI